MVRATKLMCIAVLLLLSSCCPCVGKDLGAAIGEMFRAIYRAAIVPIGVSGNYILYQVEFEPDGAFWFDMSTGRYVNELKKPDIVRGTRYSAGVIGYSGKLYFFDSVGLGSVSLASGEVTCESATITGSFLSRNCSDDGLALVESNGGYSVLNLATGESNALELTSDALGGMFFGGKLAYWNLREIYLLDIESGKTELLAETDEIMQSVDMNSDYLIFTTFRSSSVWFCPLYGEGKGKITRVAGMIFPYEINASLVDDNHFIVISRCHASVYQISSPIDEDVEESTLFVKAVRFDDSAVDNVWMDLFSRFYYHNGKIWTIDFSKSSDPSQQHDTIPKLRNRQVHPPQVQMEKER